MSKTSEMFKARKLVGNGPLYRVKFEETVMGETGLRSYTLIDKNKAVCERTDYQNDSLFNIPSI